MLNSTSELRSRYRLSLFFISTCWAVPKPLIHRLYHNRHWFSLLFNWKIRQGYNEKPSQIVLSQLLRDPLNFWAGRHHDRGRQRPAICFTGTSVERFSVQGSGLNIHNRLLPNGKHVDNCKCYVSPNGWKRRIWVLPQTPGIKLRISVDYNLWTLNPEPGTTHFRRNLKLRKKRKKSWSIRG